ncbi:MAG: biotin--[acetyl-CoA-carboxylase] ligase [Bacteroidaceae bacterium]|nr:biotin--[acetyl-CoA-carboxylase] ligase [Bacteroidaceae bacterium]
MEMMQRINLPMVDSTNNFVRDMLAFGDDLSGMTLVVAENQTAGRGQQGNSWESEPGKNLTFSILCHPDFVKPAEQFLLSQCIALAVQRAVDGVLKDCGVDEEVSVKWPNDIYVGDKKISGTLIECDLMGRNISNCIIGTGINVNQKQFVSDAPNPVSLIQLCGKEIDREKVLGDVVSHFRTLYEMLMESRDEAVRQVYMEHLFWREGKHRFEDVRGEFTAEIAGIEPTGHLILRFENGNTVRYEFKEVKFLI